jgi:MFS family permease
MLSLDIVFLFLMTLFRAPVVSLMPDHTSPEQRSFANGIINLMGGLGGFLALRFIGPYFDTSRSLPFIVVGACVFASFVLLLFVVDKNPPYISHSTEENEASAARSVLGKLFSFVFDKKNKDILLVLSGMFLLFLGYSAIDAHFTIYATEYLGMTAGQASKLQSYYGGALLIFCIPAGMLGSRFGKEKLMRVGLLLFSTAFLLGPLTREMNILILLLIMAGIGWACIVVQAYPLIADLGGKTRIGMMTGLYYLFQMGATSISPAITGFVMDIFGHRSLFILSGIQTLAAYFVLKMALAHRKKHI